jgi:hypothetical protein
MRKLFVKREIAKDERGMKEWRRLSHRLKGEKARKMKTLGKALGPDLI